MNVIEAAVLPMKSEAMDRAEKVAREHVAVARKELADAGNDLHIAAPYPASFNTTRKQYMTGLSKYRFFNNITEWREGQIVRPNSPCYADIVEAKVAEFVATARKDAAEQYDSFVAKLNAKIGPASAALLTGNHVWGYSFLFVETASGKQCWKTQMIINRSKLGKLFNQFPSRKVKA